MSGVGVYLGARSALIGASLVSSEEQGARQTHGLEYSDLWTFASILLHIRN